MVTYSTPSSRYVPRELVKLIKTSAAIGLKEVKLEQPYAAINPPVLCKGAGLPQGIVCQSCTDSMRSLIIWEAKWP